MLVKVVREQAEGNAIPSKIYLDGVFFCYGLENDAYKVPIGLYTAYGDKSPKFGTEKLYINVPNRSGILFHGGNVADQSKGCILTGRKREGSAIYGDVSDELYNRVKAAYNGGESVGVQITGELSKKALALIVAGVLAVLYMATK